MRNKKRPPKFHFIWFVSLAVICMILGDLAQPVSAQFGINSWSPAEIVFDAPGSWINWPKAVADPAGNIHAFWEYSDVTPQSGLEQTPYYVYYSRWDGNNWTNAVDILVAPEGADQAAPVLSAAIDPQGYLNVIWNGGALYFSRAYALTADDVRTWSEPTKIAEFSFQSDIQVRDDGTLFVLYPLSGKDIYLIRSQDSGISWSVPVNVSNVSSDRFTSWAKLAIDDQGILHAVWENQPIPGAYPPAGVFYAQSQDEGDTWTEPVELAGVDAGQPNLAVDNKSNIYVVWNGDATLRGRYFSASLDQGRTWSEPVDLMEGAGQKGLNGPAVLAFDSLGVLQMAISDNTNFLNGPLYANLRNNVWSYLTDISPGGRSAYSESIAGTIRLGNQLVVLIPQNFSRILFTSLNLDAPAIQAEVLPQPDLSGKVTPTINIPKATATIPAELGEISRPVEKVGINNNVIIFAGIVPAGILLILAFLIQSRKK
jgi:hypothetical protein